MELFSVEWGIDIYANSAEEAARIALSIQRDRMSSALVFDVRDEDGQIVTIDLGTPE